MRGVPLRRQSRRRTAVLLAPLFLLVPTACGGGGGDGDGPAASPSADVPGDIVVASGRDVTGKNGIRQRLIDAWNTEQEKAGTGYRARLVELPGNADEQRSQLLGALQSGSAAYDVVNLDVTWVPEFAAADLISPLPGSLLDEDVIAPVASTARWDGEVYAAPFNSDVGLLYYRRDHLSQADVEQTDLTGGLDWPELKKLINAVGDHKPDGYDKVDDPARRVRGADGQRGGGVRVGGAGPHAHGRGRDYDATVEELTEGITELRRRTEASYVLPDAFRSTRRRPSETPPPAAPPSCGTGHTCIPPCTSRSPTTTAWG